MAVRDRLRDWARRVKRDGVTLWFAGRHPHTPWPAKALGVFVVAYALSPIDLVPDFIPVLGYLDDVLLLPALICLAIRLLPPDVLAACRAQAEAWMATRGAKPRSRLGLVLVIAVWIAVAAGLWHWLAPRLASG
ncbi:YkvA family protein [Xenophilus aerolatus]|nr:YkvA family protein [Xenophilus aerolatus]